LHRFLFLQLFTNLAQGSVTGSYNHGITGNSGVFAILFVGDRINTYVFSFDASDYLYVAGTNIAMVVGEILAGWAQ